VADW
jgi:hypothetical protein